ncbi:MAG: hypothetical protein IH961_05820 [Chloroflexi bacterium]|nr:hypothetical protein [Chloroflexota bacterium]
MHGSDYSGDVSPIGSGGIKGAIATAPPLIPPGSLKSNPERERGDVVGRPTQLE